MATIQKITRAVVWMFVVTAGGVALSQQPAPSTVPGTPDQPPAVAPGGDTAPATPQAVIPAAEAPAAVPVADAATGAVAETPASDNVTMEVTGAKIQDILRALAAMRPGTQIIMTPDVQGDVSFSLKDAPWELALKLVTESNGFQYTRVGENIFRVSKASAETKSDVVIEVLEKSDVARLSDEDSVRMALILRPAVSLPPALARDEVARCPQRFIKMLQVENRPAIEVVTALAKKAGLNFTTAVGKGPAAAAPGGVPGGVPGAGAPGASQPVSLHLQNLLIEDAMKLVAEQGGLLCIQQGGVWTVKPMLAQLTPQEPLKNETLQAQFLPVDVELMKVLQKFLTERGKVDFVKNKILVRDTAQSIDGIRNALAIMDTPTPQVVIEARFFSLGKGNDSNLGLDWTDLGQKGVSVSGTPIQGYKHESVGTYTSSETEGLGTIVERESTVTNTRTAILDIAQFQATLHLLIENQNAKQLSNPKIVVSSDQQATIHIGDQVPIVKSSAQQGSGGTSALQTYELDPDYGGETVQEEQLLTSGAKTTSEKRSYTARKGYLDLGTKLTVAPSVKTEDQVYIKVVPQLTRLVSYETFGTGANTVRYPVLFSTEVRTEFTIRSGQTIAIGGLVNETETKNENHIPILGTLPFIGRFFSYESITKNETETIVFLTVKVVSAERLTGTSAIPIRARMVTEELNRIMKEDAAGAEFDLDKATKDGEKMKAEEEAAKPWWQRKKAEKKASAPEAKPTAEGAAPAAVPAEAASK